jgi:hypothetical protein
MRYADIHYQALLDAAQWRSGRPPNSPGWGMVECVKSGELKSRNGREVCRVTAGTTRYWAVRQWPEFFRPIDKRDTRTAAAHRGNLERAQHDLERGRTVTRTASLSRGRQSWRIPRPAPSPPVGLL